MTEPRTYVAERSGPHHLVTGQTPHHEDDCTPECPLNAASTNRGMSVSIFTVPASDRIQQPALVTLHPADGVSMDITNAKRVELADGSVTAMVTWEEWPTEGEVG